jgi:hypothetical protein
MGFALSILSKLCFVWIIAHLIFSLGSAAWAGGRHYQGLLFLEFQSRRARGAREAARAKLLKRLALCTVLALPSGIASFLVSALLS